MSEMVERVARAICRSLEVSEDSWPDHIDEVRAAIEAMREPTEAMIDAGSMVEDFEDNLIGSMAAKAAWQAMCDEMLK